ncbi:MAG: PilZ domain-containing protein [Proteobacteria bacterium]|nr:PilZ domain-containing protein [Pseudomonadota bacterium]
MAWYSIISEAYAINETLDTSLFTTRSTSGGGGTTFMIAFGAVIAVIAIVVYLYNRSSSKRIKSAGLQYMKKKEETQRQELDFSDDTSQRIETLAAAVGANPLKLLSNNKDFEHAVEKLRKESPSDPLLVKIPNLREDLGYTFFNRRVPFICTQMLQPGQKLRVGVKYQGKAHSYVGSILNMNEEEFWVKPPTVKGKAVNLAKFKTFDFSVFRKNDGEYRFTSKLKSQISTPANALVMAHVKKIKKLTTRENDRYKLQFKREFYFSDLNKKMHYPGVVMDISIGGLRFLVKEIPEGVIEGVNVFFKLEEAKIKQEIRAEIVRISRQKGKNYIHLQFQDMSELNRLYLQKFVSSKNPIKI